uniref:hypothetical protein n=2 Tax=Actinobacillus pleuropneumoniae TaxID=715 RepID=UPI001CDA7185|nr:hypothetical protein [Actinobacillus pleuropneumoniae]
MGEIMIIHGISLEKIKALSEAQWKELDDKTRIEYELIVSYENLLPDDFIDTKNSLDRWESDFIVEFTCT